MIYCGVCGQCGLRMRSVWARAAHACWLHTGYRRYWTFTPRMIRMSIKLNQWREVILVTPKIKVQLKRLAYPCHWRRRKQNDSNSLQTKRLHAGAKEKVSKAQVQAAGLAVSKQNLFVPTYTPLTDLDFSTVHQMEKEQALTNRKPLSSLENTAEFVENEVESSEKDKEMKSDRLAIEEKMKKIVPTFSGSMKNCTIHLWLHLTSSSVYIHWII